MIKIVAILFVAFAVAQGYVSRPFANQNDFNLANVAASQLADLTGIEGDFTVLSVRNIREEVESGNYRYSLDVLVATPENKYLFRTCEVALHKQPFQFLETPTCSANPQYPDF